MKFILEGLDRLGKDTLANKLQQRLGYHLVLHYSRPLDLACYRGDGLADSSRRYQEASFRTMFGVLLDPSLAVICNRSHLGECVYAPMYRGYSGDYVFELEQDFLNARPPPIRLVLLTENFSVANHTIDDGMGLGGPEKREQEQALFLNAFHQSALSDKRIVCVTDPISGAFRSPEDIANNVVAGLEINEDQKQ